MIQAGQIVRLKSGGPIMTAGHPHDDGTVVCVWFEGNERRQGTFLVDGLEPADNELTVF